MGTRGSSVAIVSAGARRITLAIVAMFVVTQGGCGRGSVSGGTLATAAGARLDRTTLLRWLIESPQSPDHIIANRLLSIWIDEALFARAIADSSALADTSFINAVIVPNSASVRLAMFLAAVRAKTPPPTEEQIDSTADMNTARVYQMLLVLAPRPGDSAAFDSARHRTNGLLHRAERDSDFTALVQHESDDAATRANGGFLPAVGFSDIPAPLAALIWQLQPGALAEVRTTLGFQIYRRASRRDSRPYLRRWLVPVLQRRAEDRFRDSVVKARDLALAPDAARRLREIAREPILASGDIPLAAWEGGTLSPAEARMNVLDLSPDNRLALTQLSDSLARNFVRDFAARQMLLELSAADAGLPQPVHDSLRRAYLTAVDSLTAERRRITGPQDAGAAATTVVDAAVGTGPVQRRLRGLLAGALRARYPVTLDTIAIASVVDAAGKEWAIKHRADRVVR